MNLQSAFYIHGSVAADSTSCMLSSYVVHFELKKNLHLRESTQFKTVVFKGKLYFIKN